MKQTEKQHSNLLTLIYNLINIDLQTKERLEYKDIRSYIDKALSLTHIDCDEEDIAKHDDGHIDQVVGDEDGGQ